MIAIDPAGSILLERRPSSGIWGGLWTFPQFEDEAQARSWLEKLIGIEATPDETAALPPYSHSFTHFDLTLYPIVVRPGRSLRFADEAGYCWYDPKRPARIGLAKPAVDLIQALADASLAPASDRKS